MSEPTLEQQAPQTQPLSEPSSAAAMELLDEMSTPEMSTPSLDESDETQLGMLLVISGPAGVGKDTVWKTASACLESFEKAVTCTTRAKRDHEADGVHYHFISDDEFDAMIRNDQLLEWAEVHGHRYGVPASSVLHRLNAGEDVVCVIDVQGACRIRGLFPNALLVFLKPPDENPQVLKDRIKARGGASEAEIALRLKTAKWELSQTEIYDYEITNVNVEESARQLCEVIAREKHKRLEA
jgi:guanylate kinase